MYNVFRLLKNYILGFLGSLIKKQKSPKFYLAVLMCFGISTLIIFTFTINAISSVNIFLTQNIEKPELLAMFSTTTLSLMMLLFVTIMRSVYPSKSSDSELLLSLPVTKMQIMIARGIYNYIFDFIIFAGILLPSYIVYYVLIPGSSVNIVLRGLLFLLLLPLISNAVATFVGIFCDKLARMFKRYAVIQTIISILLTGSYLFMNYSLQNYLMKAEGSAETIIDSIFVVRIILDFILYDHFINFIVMLLISCFIYGLSLLYSSSQLGKLKKEHRNNNKGLSYKAQSPLVALTKKEIKQYFSMPIYLMNTILSPILYIGLAIAAFCLGKDVALSFVQMLPATLLADFDVFVLMIFSMLISSFVISGSSISLEGDRFWIIRSNPIPNMTLFFSKILTNFITASCFIVLSFPFVISLVNIQNSWWFIVVPLITSFMSSTLGLIINLNFPKLEWDREESVVKSSIASLLSLFFPAILTIIPFIVYLISFVNLICPTIFVFMLIGYFGLLIGLFYLWLKKRGEDALYNASMK